MNRYGRGVWAGAIRYHDDRFWIYFGTPDEGYFMTTAKEIAGPWEPLHAVLREAGWDDCCPFWDDDGRVGWLVPIFRDGYKIHLWKLTSDSRDLVRESDRVIYQSRGSEANKLYKINGVYYHFFSEVQPEGRVIMMQRAKSMAGPWEERRQLKHADRDALEPNQGGFIEGHGRPMVFLHASWPRAVGRVARPACCRVTWRDGLAARRRGRSGWFGQHGLVRKKTGCGRARRHAAKQRRVQQRHPCSTMGVELSAAGRPVVADRAPWLAAAARLPAVGSRQSDEGGKYPDATLLSDCQQRGRGGIGSERHGRRPASGVVPFCESVFRSGRETGRRDADPGHVTMAWPAGPDKTRPGSAPAVAVRVFELPSFLPRPGHAFRALHHDHPAFRCTSLKNDNRHR